MEYTQSPRRQVIAAPSRVDQRAPPLARDRRERHGQCVDGEVAALEIFLERARLDAGQRARRVVGLGPHRREVEGRSRGHQLRRAKALVRNHPRTLRSRFGGEIDRVATLDGLDDEIQVADAAAEQEVPDGATHRMDTHPRRLCALDHQGQQALERLRQTSA